MTTTVANPIPRLREIRTASKARFERAAESLAEHAKSGYQLTRGVTYEYIEAFARFSVFDTALQFTDSRSIIDLEGIIAWNRRAVVGWTERGSDIDRANRIAEHEAHLQLMRVLNGER